MTGTRTPTWTTEDSEAFEPTPEVTIIDAAPSDPPSQPDDIPADILATEGRLVPMVVPPPATPDHVIVGLGALAKMDDAEFTEKLEILRRGRERVEIIQKTLMREGEDYGKVRGIERPFLHLPGAEQLEKFYGYAVRQEVDRLIGERAKQRVGETEVEGEWISPPIAYHVRSYVHLGSFDGPIIDMGYGEANSWEDKYRWRWEKQKCPNCGREGLVRGKKDGPLKGKLWCPGRDGGCNQKFEPGVVPPPAKVENTDPYSLAETLIQMAAKRSFVAAIRRATGTSGLFTQDEDSPSVRQQTEGETPDEPTIDVGPPPEGVVVGKGAKTEGVTTEQLRRLSKISKDKDIGPIGLSVILRRLFEMDVDPDNSSVLTAIKGLTAEQFGMLLRTAETGEVPDPTPPETTTSGSPSTATTPPATNTGA